MGLVANHQLLGFAKLTHHVADAGNMVKQTD